MGGASMTYQVTDKMVNTFAQAMLLSMPEVTDHYDQVKFGLEAVFKELETTCTRDGGYCGIGGFCNKTEVDELKAQVNALREELKMLNIGLSFSLCHDDGVIKRSDIKKLISDVDKELEATPEQCLAEVKAKAIEEAITEATRQGDGMQINVTPYFHDYRVIKFINTLKGQVALLREQAE